LPAPRNPVNTVTGIISLDVMLPNLTQLPAEKEKIFTDCELNLARLRQLAYC